jgi:thiol-disulfide isomerase/thioredoxin
MKTLFVFILLVLSFNSAFGQNEQSPIVEKDITYNDWVYKNVKTGADMNLRKFTFGKKLVMVVYFAPWCGNWKHDAPFVQRMYDKYKANGFDVVAVGEYDPVDAMKKHIDAFKLTFPVVYESDARTAKQTTLHYQYRKATGDTRNWGSPWYVFLEVAKLEPVGMVFTKRTNVVNGELIEAEAEKFIREKLGLPAAAAIAAAGDKAIEVCAPEEKKPNLVKP